MSYPLVKFSFLVEWDDKKIGFTEVSGINKEVEAIEYREGSNPVFTKLNMPGMVKFGDITLKKGTFQSDNEFYDWIETIQLNQVERKNVTISLLNENQDPVVTWKVNDAWPMKLECTDLKGDGNEVAIETMVLKHAGFTIQND